MRVVEQTVNMMSDDALGETGTISSIWYADKTRADSKWKYLVYDAKGSLSADALQLRFSGSEFELSIKWFDVTGFGIRKQTFASSLSASFVGIASFFGFLTGAMNDLHPVVAAIAGAMFYPILYLISRDAIAKKLTKPWTVVTYRAATQDFEAWFADGARMGLGAGNDSRIYDLIAGHLSRSPQSPII